MQDYRDGSLHPFEDALLEKQKKALLAQMPRLSFAETNRRALVATGEAKGIPEKYQGPVFELGEQLVIKGGRFKVARFKHGKMLLQGLPQEDK